MITTLLAICGGVLLLVTAGFFAMMAGALCSERDFKAMRFSIGISAFLAAVASLLIGVA